MDTESVFRVLERAQVSGLLLALGDDEANEERARVYLAACATIGADEPEATVAVLDLGRRTGEDKIAWGRMQPGDLLEAILERRRRAEPARAQQCGECDQRGLIRVERDGQSLMRRCGCRGGRGAAALPLPARRAGSGAVVSFAKLVDAAMLELEQRRAQQGRS